MGANVNVNTQSVISFLQGLARHIRNPIIVVWDRLPAHRAQAVSRYLLRRGRLRIELLPPYAPELNPVETLWSYLKQNPLANLAATDAEHLRGIARKHIFTIRKKQDLLKSLIAPTPLSLRL